jgi:hypothetical protein
MDFILAIFIFSLCLVLYYKILPNVQSQELNNLNNVYLDAKIVSESLVTQGYPPGWNRTDVQRIGITDGGSIINYTKLYRFRNMTLEDYNRTRSRFGIKSDFAVFFTGKDGLPANLSGIWYVGNPRTEPGPGGAVSMGGVSHNNLAGLTRILVYNRSIVNMVVYAWQ